MRKLLSIALALSVLAGACGDSGSSEFSSCDDLAQAGLDMLQDILDEVSTLSEEEFLEAVEEEEPAFLTKFDGEADRLDEGQVDLGCSDAELEGYLVDNIDTLTADGEIAQLMRDAIVSDPEGFLDS